MVSIQFAHHSSEDDSRVLFSFRDCCGKSSTVSGLDIIFCLFFSAVLAVAVRTDTMENRFSVLLDWHADLPSVCLCWMGKGQNVV